MRATPIPDNEIFPGHKRIVLGPPSGDPDDPLIRPVEMQAVHDPRLGTLLYRARFICEGDDAARLAAGEPFYLTLWGIVPPFDCSLMVVE